MAEHCWGIQPYMLNSLTLAIPATILSTLLGALAGYSISLWRFRGDQFVFGVVTLGIFLPEQMKLIPWAVVLRDLGADEHHRRPGADPHRAGHQLHDAVLPQLLCRHPRRT